MLRADQERLFSKTSALAYQSNKRANKAMSSNLIASDAAAIIGATIDIYLYPLGIIINGHTPPQQSLPS